jgi:type IV secretory pathway TraG/TraD family ATPase VirD4
MNSVWGRRESKGWPNSTPVNTITALVIALAFATLAGYCRYVFVWTPLERQYLRAYVLTELMARLGAKTDQHDILVVVTRKAKRLAVDDDVIPVKTPAGQSTFTLTTDAVKHGALRLEWLRRQYDNRELHAFLGTWIYDGQTILDLATRPLWLGLAVFVIGLFIAAPKDAAHLRELRYGRRLKGPEFVTGGEFNSRNRSGGIGFTNGERTMVEKIFGWNRRVRVPHDREASHFLMMGDTGGGKSTLIREMLLQIQDRDDTAIVYDPEREYTPEFYNPERGDVILNPLDVRSPFWTPGDEVRNEPEAFTLAASLFPYHPGDQRFFTRGPREIFAHMMSFKPTPHQLADWMSRDEEIDRRIRGTALASLIAANAPSQREGVMSELKMVAMALKLLPKEEETKTRWSAREWSRHRKGWLFFTTTKTTRERLLPLTSLWLDLLVLRLMDEAPADEEFWRRVWFILDELHSLQKLPQLHAAITQNRKSNNPLVLGLQGRSQLEVLYGHEAEVMLSQPATKIFLRTNEAHAARWISETIGEVEIEQLRESHASEQFPRDHRSKSFQLERRTEPLVMASEITGLPNRCGFLKSGNLVVRLSFPFLKLPKIQPALIERNIDWQSNIETAEPDAERTGGSGGPGQKLTPHEQKQAQEQARRRTQHGQGQFFR